MGSSIDGGNKNYSLVKSIVWIINLVFSDPLKLGRKETVPILHFKFKIFRLSMRLFQMNWTCNQWVLNNFHVNKAMKILRLREGDVKNPEFYGPCLKIINLKQTDYECSVFALLLNSC